MQGWREKGRKGGGGGGGEEKGGEEVKPCFLESFPDFVLAVRGLPGYGF